MLIAERFLSSLINKYGKHHVSTDGERTWHPHPPQACKFLKLKHHFHFSFEKSVIERTVQYIKYTTEGFDYFPCERKKNSCELQHIKQWFALFIDKHNESILS